MFSFKTINIFSGEKIDNWILGKFAKILKQEYERYGINTKLSYELDNTVDFNQCLIYLNCNPDTASKKDVVMITHVDQYAKFELLEKLLPKISLGICMSKDQMDKLINLGLDKNKLCYINPAHDGIIPVRKYVIGLASRVYSDGRKNEHYFDKLAEVLDCDYFKFKIMGANWEPQIKHLKEYGFEVEYYNKFDYKIYTKEFFTNLDYYLYTGFDEGQMGFVDAQSAGINTIVSSQGYHLDSNTPITFSFNNYEELEQIFLNLQNERKKIVDNMQSWTWENYAIKHLQIFEYLKTGKIIENSFKDGLNSLLENKNKEFKYNEEEKQKYIKFLRRKIIYKDINYNAAAISIKEFYRKIMNKIFTITNIIKNNKKYKQIIILGIKIKFSKNKENKCK